MKKIFLSFFMFFSLLSFGQNYAPFPDSNAVWREHFHDNYNNHNHYQYGIIGDTILNSLSYHKLYLQNNCLGDTAITPGNSILVGAIRENEVKQIFFYCLNPTGLVNCEKDSVYKLYDFSANVGDTIRFNCNNYFFQYYTVVDSIDSVWVYDQYRKKFYVQGDTWIEGMGSLRSLLSPVLAVPTCLCVWENVCYEHNNITYYLNPPYLDCYKMDYGIHDAFLNKMQIGFYPNPVSDYATLDLSLLEMKVSKIEFYDVLGEKIKIIDVPTNSIVELRQGMLKPGVYFYSVIAEGKRFYIGKLIVE